MNFTLSIDDDLIAKAMAYAQARDMTLNQLVRDYLQRVTGKIDPRRAAEEFAELARSQPGRSDEDFAFDRAAAHARPPSTKHA